MYAAAIILNIKIISVRPLHWMNAMLDFLWMEFTELYASGNKQKLKLKTYASSRNQTSDPSLSNVLISDTAQQNIIWQ